MTAASIPFVEPKEPDWNNIMQLAAPAIEARRWANFGPISEGLAAEVAKVAGLPESRVAVPASSGTTALHAVVGMHEILAERPLIWIVSAFGFLATVIGPLADRVRVIDCDRTGMLDLDQVAALAPDSWDGLLVTDLFGFNLGISRYQAFCEAAGKPLVIDSATSFPGTWGSTRRASEVISFHHTKPWGFGEGGCAIVDRAHADLVRTLLSHGKGLAAFSQFATNGKMSDVAAIVILDRLLRMPDWSPAYHQQRDRMLSLAATAEIDCLGRPAQAVISPHVPLLAPHPIAAEGMPRTRFKLEKYYRPLSAYCPVATDIYSRIVNVPCHPMMAEVADTEILACLDDIRARMRA